MASFRKRNSLWQAQVRSRSLGSVSKSFHNKSDAVAWAKAQEVMMQTGKWKPKDQRYSTIGDLMKTYLEKTTPRKKGAETETITIIQALPKIDDRIFPVTDTALRQSWERLRKRSRITDLTFHDLRHEAISRCFDEGMSVPQVMAISGHQTASQLFRYVQLKPEQ